MAKFSAKSSYKDLYDELERKKATFAADPETFVQIVQSNDIKENSPMFKGADYKYSDLMSWQNSIQPKTGKTMQTAITATGAQTPALSTESTYTQLNDALVDPPVAPPVAQSTNGIISLDEWTKRFGTDTDAQHQQAIKAAYDAYSRTISTYGKTAENLAQAGLTGSGVSDNLQRGAYAQQQDALQTALANKNLADTQNKQQYSVFAENEQTKLDDKATAQKSEQDSVLSAFIELSSKQGVSYDTALKQIKAMSSISDEAKAFVEQYAKDNSAELDSLTGKGTLKANAATEYKAYINSGESEADTKTYITNTYGKDAYDYAVGQYGTEKTGIIGKIAPLDTKTVSADSLIGKYLSSDITTEDFLKEAQAATGKTYAGEDEAIEDLTNSGYITKEQRDSYYLGTHKNALLNAVDTETASKALKKTGEGTIYAVISDAYKAYADGRMSEKSWNEFKDSIFSGKDGLSISVGASERKGIIEGRDTWFTVKVGSKEESFGINNALYRGVSSKEKSNQLDKISNGGDLAYYDGELYFKNYASTGKVMGWIEMGNVTGTEKTTLVEILKMLAPAYGK